MLTPAGVLQAFGSHQPDAQAQAMQLLLTEDQALDQKRWMAIAGVDDSRLAYFQSQGWIEALPRPMQGPDAKLDDFLQHVIGTLSAQRCAVLASNEGFCLGFCGVSPDQAELLSATAADFSDFVQRQEKRGWKGATRYAAFHSDPEFLLPEHSFIPFWVDGTGYWLILLGEPLLNNPAIVELLWGIKLAGTRFLTSS